MDEFVKSVVGHIMGKETAESYKEYRGRDSQSIYEKEGDGQAAIYRPNYQRRKENERTIQSGTFLCVDTEPEDDTLIRTGERENGLEEDLRWLKLTAAREVR